MSTLCYDNKIRKITGSDYPNWKSYNLPAHSLAVGKKKTNKCQSIFNGARETIPIPKIQQILLHLKVTKLLERRV